ncbi:hypothetical protein PENTCL1PPCAC_29763, partial [Pristionchus entomophagus]
MPPFACHDNAVRIGYVETVFPKFYVNAHEEWKGFIVDLWQTFAKVSGCRSVEFVKIDNYSNLFSAELVLDVPPSDGHLGEIYARRLFADAWGTLMNPSRLKYFMHSAVIAFEEVNFYTTTASSHSETYEPVNHYIVFTPQAFAFVICLQLIVTALTSRFKNTLPLFDFAKRACVIIFLLGFTSLVVAYSSAFKEAHYVYHEPTPINLDEMQNVLNNGKGKFIATESSVAEVYTSNYEIVPFLHDITDRMCARYDHYFTSMTNQKYVQVHSFDLPEECLFKKILKEPKSATLKLPVFASLPFSFFIILNKSTPRREVVRLNRLIRTVFNADLRDGFYIRRYTPINQLKKILEERSFNADSTRFRSLSLTNLTLPFLSYLACILITICTFLFEYLSVMMIFKRV